MSTHQNRTPKLSVEIDPTLVEKNKTNARNAGVADKTEFLLHDLFKNDLAPATTVPARVGPHTPRVFTRPWSPAYPLVFLAAPWMRLPGGRVA